MAKIQINGVERPIATNMRAMRLFKEKTGRGMLGFISELAAAAEREGDGTEEETALDLLDAPAELCALIWSALNGPKGAEVAYDEVETLTLAEMGPALAAVTDSFNASAMGKSDGEPVPQAATVETTTTSTSESSGASDAAA